MKIQDVIEQAPQYISSGAGVKLSGMLGGSTALAGITTDLSGWSELSQIIANFGIGLGAVVAALSLGYTIYKGKDKK